MPDWNAIFDKLQDTVIVTDIYGYILDFNRLDPLPGLRKGKKITKYMPCVLREMEDEYRIGDRLFLRQISAVEEKVHKQGYLVILSDITERTELMKLNIQKNKELREAAEEQERANRELSEYIRQVEALADASEQLRLARVIHDGLGHAVTDLFTVSQMGLMLRESDRTQFDAVMAEGIAICDRSLSAADGEAQASDTLEKRLTGFVEGCLFPIDLRVEGTEPDWVEPLRYLIRDICEEGYHNVLDHSLADRMFIHLKMSGGELLLELSDNGSFHGTLEKGFGLTSMEERVKASSGEIAFRAVPGEGFGITVRWCRAE